MKNENEWLGSLEGTNMKEKDEVKCRAGHRWFSLVSIIDSPIAGFLGPITDSPIVLLS